MFTHLRNYLIGQISLMATCTKSWMKLAPLVSTGSDELTAEHTNIEDRIEAPTTPKRRVVAGLDVKTPKGRSVG